LDGMKKRLGDYQSYYKLSLFFVDNYPLDRVFFLE
jgi:hypothetical protein